MLNTLNQLQLLDVIALKEPLPENGLLAGQVGTIVELLAPDVYEVDFSDNNGQTYAMLSLHTSQLLKLHYVWILIDRSAVRSDRIRASACRCPAETS
ncbi:DUF4926 domain-containing protein [Microcoleus sp. FACHB-1515]|uniref:DUF4926 domain-containing protein n=1 Tax=Cyanophyceae TaxID=3028117 RepID=UPI0016856108|nr:DUF4926 domain-containing protein [Microcoleus sp. FACHB-1515]MBD2089527.1 DUF4926 domain-containing protein [Microcoleus sp. FACHB-1515]